MTILISVFIAMLVPLAYLALRAVTSTRRLVAVIGILLLHVGTFVWIQILARAVASRVEVGPVGIGAGALFLEIRPVLLLQGLICAVLVILCICRRSRPVK